MISIISYFGIFEIEIPEMNWFNHRHTKGDFCIWEDKYTRYEQETKLYEFTKPWTNLLKKSKQFQYNDSAQNLFDILKGKKLFCLCVRKNFF